MQFIFFQCFLSVYIQYLWPISPISPLQCFYVPWWVWSSTELENKFLEFRLDGTVATAIGLGLVVGLGWRSDSVVFPLFGQNDLSHDETGSGHFKRTAPRDNCRVRIT